MAEDAGRHRRGGLARLAALLVLLAGIFSMHGLATSTPGGQHHLPLLDMSAIQLEFHSVAAAHAGGADAAAAQDIAMAQGGQSHDAGSGLLAGCMVVLAGMVLTLLLLALQRHGHAEPGRAAPVDTQPRTPRAPPPRRPRISLCVLRV